MAKKFGEVVIAKDDSHYGLALVSNSKAKSMVTKAEALTNWAAKVLASCPTTRPPERVGRHIENTVFSRWRTHHNGNSLREVCTLTGRRPREEWC